MTILMDEILQEIVDQAYGAARLGRNGDSENREVIFAKVLAELEVAGDAMRFVDSEGRIAWKATPSLRNYLMDLQRDAEAEFEAEDV
jgi:tRNA-binding EMAP/Myf-like protein